MQGKVFAAAHPVWFELWRSAEQPEGKIGGNVTVTLADQIRAL